MIWIILALNDRFLTLEHLNVFIRSPVLCLHLLFTQNTRFLGMKSQIVGFKHPDSDIRTFSVSDLPENRTNTDRYMLYICCIYVYML